METVNGVPVTDEMIQQWADEAEQGYDVKQLRKRGRKTMGDGPARVVPVRVDPCRNPRLRRVKIAPSALKHGISELDILYAAENWAYASQPDEDIPAKQFVLGFDLTGRLLELAILTFDSGQ